MAGCGWIFESVSCPALGGAPTSPEEVITRKGGRLVLKFRAERSARIKVQDTLADALRKCVGKLESHKSAVIGWEGDMPIKVGFFQPTVIMKLIIQMSNLAQHIQLLVSSFRDQVL